MLRRPLYGLKQSPRQWYLKFHNFMIGIGFDRCFEDTCTYVIRGKGHQAEVYLLIYVDDMLIASSDITQVEEVKSRLKSCFDMKDLGKASKILKMEIHRDRSI